MADFPLKAYRFLLALTEMEPPRSPNRIVEECMGPSAELAKASRLLVPGPTLDGVPAYPGDMELRPILEEDEEAGTVTCFHPGDGFVAVPQEYRRTWCVDTDQLATIVARQLGLPTSFRPTVLMAGLLWDLGTPRLGQGNHPVLFARRLADEAARSRMRAELDLRLGQKPALLLTTAGHVAADLKLPTISKIVPVTAVLDRTSSVARLDLLRLAAMAGLARPQALGSTSPVECVENGRLIKIHGNIYRFQGKQAEVIRRLYEAWCNGVELIGEQEILEGVGSDSLKLRQLFRKSEKFSEVIDVKGGLCRLHVGGDSEV